MDAELIEKLREIAADLMPDDAGTIHAAITALSAQAEPVSAEPEGEVVWQYRSAMGAWLGADATNAARLESEGVPIRAIRVIATTTKGVG